MTSLGVFNDTLYDPVVILPKILFTANSQASGTIPAAQLAGAQEVHITASGATALTTDTAANIIQAFVNALAQNGASTELIWNGTNYSLYIHNTNASTLTLSGGTGVTITGTATIATTVTQQFQVTVTGPNLVAIQVL